jgi:hypothetical protein
MTMSQAGQVLVHAPEDSNGLWIEEDVARELNKTERDRLREGFTIAMINARGVHTSTRGQAERELAQMYREKAQAADLAGYPRLGGAVRAVADSFARDAERNESRDPFDE